MAINGFNVQCNVSSISLRRLVSTVDGIQAGLYGVGGGAAAAKEGRRGGGSVSVAGVKGNGSQSGVIGNYQLQEEQTIVRRLGQS